LKPFVKFGEEEAFASFDSVFTISASNHLPWPSVSGIREIKNTKGSS
jgi:hypothetical protein